MPTPIKHSMAQINNVQETPITFESVPIKNPPIGVLPANSRMYKLITRPRSASGTVSCSSVLALVEKIMPAKPSAINKTAETAKFPEKATNPSRTLNQAEPIKTLF